MRNGEILNQSKIDCEIVNVCTGKELLEAMGYKEIMRIKEQDIVYSNGQFELSIKDIENGEKLIEVEVTENNKNLDTIEKIKKAISELCVPIDPCDYFVKKAEIELEKVLKSKNM